VLPIRQFLSLNGVKSDEMPYIFTAKQPQRLPQSPVRDQPGGNRQAATAAKDGHMWRLIKLVFWLAVLGFLGLSAYSFVADMTPAPQEVRQPVTLNAD
jgi:hypothetical protein